MSPKSSTITLSSYLADDHRRLDGLLAATVSPILLPSDGCYRAFRAGLLRHIGIEEKIVWPALRQAIGELPRMAGTAKVDHGALAAILVLPPYPEIVQLIRDIVSVHNEMEEGPNGLYALCDTGLGRQTDRVVAMAEAASEIAVAPTTDRPDVWKTVARIVARAGYALPSREMVMA